MNCRRRHSAAETKRLCPRCDRLGFIRVETGWCGNCSRPGPSPKPPRPCSACGRHVRRLNLGLCGRCWQRHPDRARNQAERLADSLDDAPWWLADFGEFAAQRHCMGRACTTISAVGHLLTDGNPTHPQQLLERSRRSGRSAGVVARTLEEFFVERDLAFGLDQKARLAAGRRQRRIDAAPEPLRPTIQSFAEHLIASQQRAQRAGTHPRADSTIETALAAVRDLAVFLVDHRSKTDWATVQPADIEAFLNDQPNNRRRRLSDSRRFFRWAKHAKVVLVDPTTNIKVQPRAGFSGATLSINEQRQLFARWTSGKTHPHEAVVGMLALLHAFSNAELRNLHIADIDAAAQTLRVEGRPHPTPMDPASLAAIQRCVDQHASLATQNPHLIVTKITATRTSPASSAYLTHILNPADVTIKRLRSTRLIDLIISLDPKLVAEALGMNAEGLLDYLADAVDNGRLEPANL